MPESQSYSKDRTARGTQPQAPSTPSLSLPKGGGAIRGIGEKFAANPATGSGALTIPVYTSPGRSGFGPKFALSYDSGSGNGAFGFGWSLALPAITRKTDKGLPQYEDAHESDIFILSGAEDLIPTLVESAGQWIRDVTQARTVYGNQYTIRQYRPRVDNLFARIERWTNLSNPQDTFWRSISKDNITTWYGKTAESRICDPGDATRVFSWLVCETYDDKGNVTSYEYKPEDSQGVDTTQVHERNRSDATRSVNRYIKRVFYGNRTPYFPDLTAGAETPLPNDCCFELVFDYGDHDLLNPVPQDTGLPWACRLDPFSTYRSTFEIRTYRLCRRALMFHNFPHDPDVGLNCLVCSTDLTHPSASPADPSQAPYSYLLSVTQSSFVRNGAGGYSSDALPPLSFEYTQATIDETVRDVDPNSLVNVPNGLDGSNYRWVDLDGEGLSGILTDQSGSWFYKANLSPVNRQAISGMLYTLPRFAPTELVARLPSTTALNRGEQQLLSLSGDGQLALVNYRGSAPGYYERTPNADWAPFVPFESLPVVDWRNPELKFIDVTGDGFPDLLISEGDAFWWYKSLSTQGFDSGQRVPQAFDEETGPKLVFADGTESIFLADVSGDNLTDLVRIRNGEISYWPNRGYGKFGAKVTMDNAPLFDHPDLFDGRRIRLADIDGSGAADIVYLGSDSVQLYFNRSGNGYGPARVLAHFQLEDSASQVSVLDLLGNGTACLVWSSSLPGNARRQMCYIDLMGGQKPHLLVRETNNLGAASVVYYAPSTRFYVADKLAGTPWVTRLPFPVQVVERIETYDYLSRNLFVTRYSYHHGYYDGVEREFRGFGRVDQWDTEEFATLMTSPEMPSPTNVDAASDVPPIYTKTWFHTGAYFGESAVSKYMEGEYYSEGDRSDGIAGLTAAQLNSMLLADTLLPSDILLSNGNRFAYDLSPEERREACRALRGSLLRQEVYALDNTNAADRPYSVSEQNYTIEALQPQGPNLYATFFAHPRETIDFQYERALFKVAGNTIAGPGAPGNAQSAADPRVSHALTLAVNQFGNVLQSANVSYGRRYLDPALTPPDQAKQSAMLSTYVESVYTNAIDADDVHRIPLPATSNTYELIQVAPSASLPGITNLFAFAELQAILQTLALGANDIAYENLNPTGLTPGQPYRRPIGETRNYYRPDDMGAAAGNARALLPLGVLESLGLSGNAYKLAFTPGLIAQVYQRSAVELLPAPAGLLGSLAGDGGGYVDLDGDQRWWIPGSRSYYIPTAPASPQELNQAQQHFFLPRRLEDPFGNASAVDYDADDLLLAQTTDAIGNTASVSNDYRVLAPRLLTDANGNQGAVTFNIFGLVTATAVMGKAGQNLGDNLSGFSADLTQAQIDTFYDAADPHTLAAPLLGNASTRVIYDVHRFSNSQQAAPSDPTKWQPTFAATIAREIHVSDLGQGQQSPLQISFSYSDGFEREMQKKVQAEPGPVVDGGPVVNPRWVGSGWTIFNNRAKPVRQYEPFFSQLPVSGHQFEFGVQIGVSPILCYDPAGRVVATIQPNQTYAKTVFDPWHQETWDINDTVLENNPTTDTDVGEFFQRLPAADYSPTWYSQRSTNGLGSLEQDAATKAAVLANTPGVAYLDSFGRTFLSVADNGAFGKYLTHFDLDIQNNQRSVTDALNRQVMIYDYAITGERIHQASMEAGARWNLSDATGKSIRAWDSRGHNFRSAYDANRRPVQLFVLGTDPVNSDPRTTGGEVLFDQIDYGEGQANDQQLNLRTRVWQHHDMAGVVVNMGTDPVSAQIQAYDFKGNLLRASRQFIENPQLLPDWAKAPPAFLPGDPFVSATKYDALNRVIAATAPDGSVATPTYNETGLIESISVNLRGAAAATAFVNNIDYDAKGQRILVEYGNNTATAYKYDPLTFRLTNLTTTRHAFPTNQRTVQDLAYTYDPVGNITHIQDNADIQNVVYFSNQRVEPSAGYTYDATYRLINASGRELLGLVGNNPSPPTPTSYNDFPRAGQLQPGDGKAMGLYTEQYVYDAVGNFLTFIHRGSNPANPGWTRTYTYNEASLLEAGKFSNRLSNSKISGNLPLVEPYTYDLHGNMLTMPQLQAMQWDFKDQLEMTRRQAVNASDQDGVLHQGQRTYYVYDASGQRARKTTFSSAGIKLKERFYTGGYEVYREYDGTGNKTLERETLHVMDDKKRIALIETKTVDTSVPAGVLPSTTTRYQFDNHLGTACLELDQTAAVITYEEYYPYGSTSYQAGRTVAEVSLKRYRYIGKERDEETGFNYHLARYYAPWLGRWVAPDPALTELPLSTMMYSSCRPTVMVDPSGLEPDEIQIHIEGQGDYPASEAFEALSHLEKGQAVPKPGEISAERAVQRSLKFHPDSYFEKRLPNPLKVLANEAVTFFVRPALAAIALTGPDAPHFDIQEARPFPYTNATEEVVGNASEEILDVVLPITGGIARNLVKQGLKLAETVVTEGATNAASLSGLGPEIGESAQSSLALSHPAPSEAAQRIQLVEAMQGHVDESAQIARNAAAQGDAATLGEHLYEGEVNQALLGDAKSLGKFVEGRSRLQFALDPRIQPHIEGGGFLGEREVIGKGLRRGFADFFGTRGGLLSGTIIDITTENALAAHLDRLYLEKGLILRY